MNAQEDQQPENIKKPEIPGAGNPQHSSPTSAAKPIPCIPFNSKDAKLDYYRDNIFLMSLLEPISRLGWKVADFEADEEDLFMKCCNLISTELLFPVHVFTNLIQYDKEHPQLKYPIKSLWIETSIHTTADSKEQIYQNTAFPGGKARQFCEVVLLPALRAFLKSHVSWQQLMKSGLDEYSILSLFQAEVIGPCNKWIEAITPPRSQ